MRKFRLPTALLLTLLFVTLTACSKGSEPESKPSVTLEMVRKQAGTAFDGTISSAERRIAADEAMQSLLALLNQPESAGITNEEWSKSSRPGVATMVRHQDLGGGIHLYALTLPGNSLVETRERVAVQVRKTGSDPVAQELTVLPDSKLQAARTLKDGKRQLITLALSQNTGGGYVAHFEMSGDDGFKQTGSVFSGLAGKYGRMTLTVKESVLMVSQEGMAEWRPAFDEKQPLRLILGPDLTLDWKQRFVVVDDSKFDAFALLKIAQDPSLCKGALDCPESLLAQAKQSPKEAAVAAWQQAITKMDALLQNEKSWSDDFTGQLPQGARSIRESGRELSVRIISIPAPEGVSPSAYNAVQFRTGNGLPMTRMVTLPGVVESYRVISHEGAPALFMVVDQTKDPKSNVRTKGLHLLRLNAGNDWVPATSWVGSIPNAPHWNLVGSNPNGVLVEWEVSKSPNMTVSLGDGAEPSVSICKLGKDCHELTWVDGKLHSLKILSVQLTEATRALPEDQLLWRADQLAQFLAAIDPAQVAPSKLASLLDPNGALGLRVLDAGRGTRLVTMPSNPTGVRTAVVHSRNQALVVQSHDSMVDEWIGAQVVQGGNEQRLLILGRSDKGVVMVAYHWDGENWVPVDPLPHKVDQVLAESVRVINTPGQTRPVHGLVVFGGSQLSARLTTNGAEFCENQIACVTYGYNKGWQLQTK